MIKRIFLETEINTKQHFLTETKFIRFDEKETQKEEDLLSYAIHFPPLEQEAKTIRILYEKKNEDPSNGLPAVYSVVLSSYINIRPVVKPTNSENLFMSVSLSKAKEIAKKANKKILLYYTAGWCAPCKRMETYIFSDPEVRNAIQNFVPVKVDVDSRRGEKVTSIYGRKGMPSFFVLDNKGAIYKKNVGALKKSEMLDFLIVDPLITPKQPAKNLKPEVQEDTDIGLRLGYVNNTIRNLSNASASSGITIDALFAIDYDRRYLIRTGVGFSSKGIDGMTVNYLRVPFEFGYSIYKGQLFNLPGAVRLIGAPYYSLRLSENNTGISNHDYGMRLGLAPHIGVDNELAFEIYYELGMNDLYKNIGGFQNNRSFGFTVSLSL